MSVNSKMTAIADAIRNLLDINEIMGLDAMASSISSITKRGAVTGTIHTKSEKYVIPAGYHNGIGTVEISPGEQAKLIAENIKNGVTILGVAGSASGEIFSIIAVTYPEGSVCTCSNNTTTMAAKDTSGKALFNVTVGEWTVTATDGDKTKSQTVSITADGQIENVTISYVIDLINSNDITGGWSVGYNQNSTPTITTDVDKITVSSKSTNTYQENICTAVTKNSIDLSGRTQITVNVTDVKVLELGEILVGLVKNRTSSSLVSSVKITAKNEYSLSITPGSYYVAIYIKGDQEGVVTGTSNITVNKLVAS